MSRLHIATRGIGSWRERLANPDEQWRRGYSAFETAVSWEVAENGGSGLPLPIQKLLHQVGYRDPVLVFAVAEHKVPLRGGGHASQCDVWAIVDSSQGKLSVTVEAKANEAFGDKNLDDWLKGSGSEESKTNRRDRWEFVRGFLPASDFSKVRFQILHRCAAAVIEAKRFGFRHAGFVVQSFKAPIESFDEYTRFCAALKIPAEHGRMAVTSIDGISLCVGWADCERATDGQIAEIA